MKHRNLSTKDLMYPLPATYVRRISLVFHLALACCRNGQGNSHQLYQLIRMTYLSWIMWKDGVGETRFELYRDAETALERTAKQASKTGTWLLDQDADSAIREVMVLLDTQLDAVSRHRYLRGMERLEHLLRIEIPQKLNSGASVRIITNI